MIKCIIVGFGGHRLPLLVLLIHFHLLALLPIQQCVLAPGGIFGFGERLFRLLGADVRDG